MPTGYTAPVADGKVTEFRQFALLCARAFGACITLKEEDMNIPAPPKIDPDTSFYEERLKDSKAKKACLLSLTPEQKKAECHKDYISRLECYEASKAESDLKRQRYEAMLVKVQAWKAPLELGSLQAFMGEQIRESIAFDCSPFRALPPREEDPESWYKESLADVDRNIERYLKYIKEEITRAEERTAWLQALHKSLENT